MRSASLALDVGTPPAPVRCVLRAQCCAVLRFPTAPGSTSDGEDDLIDIFMEVASTAISEPDSTAATVPIVLEGPAESIGGIKWLKFESDFDTLAVQLREEAIRRFANGLEVPVEILLGLGDANHWCTLPDTEIMTEDGWKTYDQLTPGELVLTLNHETGLSEWQPPSDSPTQMSCPAWPPPQSERPHCVITCRQQQGWAG